MYTVCELKLDETGIDCIHRSWLGGVGAEGAWLQWLDIAGREAHCKGRGSGVANPLR